MKVTETYNISDFIEAGKSVDLTYHNFSILQKINNIEYPIFNVINHYLDELKAMSVPVRLSDKEYNKYRLEPKILAYDIYKETELYFILLAINDICDIKEFDFRKVNIIRPQDIAIVNRIFDAEKKYINENRTDIKGV